MRVSDEQVKACCKAYSDSKCATWEPSPAAMRAALEALSEPAPRAVLGERVSVAGPKPEPHPGPFTPEREAELRNKPAYYCVHEVFPVLDELRAELQAAHLRIEELLVVCDEHEALRASVDAFCASNHFFGVERLRALLKPATPEPQPAPMPPGGVAETRPSELAKMSPFAVDVATPEPQAPEHGCAGCLFGGGFAHDHRTDNATVTQGHQPHASQRELYERVERLEAALRHILRAMATGYTLADAFKALAMLDARKQEGGE
jgi:hypothetical protein